LTLIVCLKAQDCVVLAADSLTTRGGTVTSCTTEKLHRIGVEAVTAGCGLSRVMGQDWSGMLDAFPQAAAETPFTTLASHLNAFLESMIARIPRHHIGANRGGNTFLLAAPNHSGAGMAVARLTRINIDYRFQAPSIASSTSDDRYIDWIGDVDVVAAHRAAVEAAYAPGMSEADAIDFAVAAIRDGIAASVAAGNHTIGGDLVGVAVVGAGTANLFQVPSDRPCAVAATSAAPAPST
jgi:hypothetical protein